MDTASSPVPALELGERVPAPARSEAFDNRLADAFFRSPIASALLSGGGLVTQANDAMARLLGRRPDDLAGMALRDLIHPDDAEDHDELARRLDEGQIDGFALELRLAHAEWTWVWVELHLSMVRDEHGVRRWGLAHMMDLTERRLAEAETQQFFELAEASLDFVSLFDLDGTVRFVNRGGPCPGGPGGRDRRPRAAPGRLPPHRGARPPPAGDPQQRRAPRPLAGPDPLPPLPHRGRDPRAGQHHPAERPRRHRREPRLRGPRHQRAAPARAGRPAERGPHVDPAGQHRRHRARPSTSGPRSPSSTRPCARSWATTR